MDSSTPPLLPDTMEQRLCRRCGKTQRAKDFYPGRSVCKQCHKAVMRMRDYPPTTDGTKTCNKCGIEKHVTNFYPSRNNRDGRSYECKSCTASRKLQNDTGATSDWKAIKLALQGGVCALCGKGEGEGQGGAWVVDHSEPNGVKTQHAVLHHNCNGFIAIAGHDPAMLYAGAKYIERTR